MSNNDIYVYIFGDPAGKKTVDVKSIPWRRQRLSTIVNAYKFHKEMCAYVNNEFIPRSEWKTKRVTKAATINILPETGFIGSLIFGAGLFATLFNVGAAIGLSYLGGVLLGPNIKEPKAISGSQNYAWDPHTIQSEGAPTPKCFGRNMHVGNVIANWTDVEDGDEVLYLTLCYGTGPAEGRVANLNFIDDRPMGQFTGITLYERLGTLDQTAIFPNHKQEYRPDNLIVPYNDAKTVTTPNNYFDDVEITVECPKGLWFRHKTLTPGAGTVGYTIEVSEKGVGSWTEVVREVLFNSTHSPIYNNYKLTDEGFSFDNGKQYDIRVVKLNPDSVDGDRFENTIKIRSFREVINTGFKRPGKVLLGIKAVGTKQFSGTMNIKTTWDDSICYLYDGADWILEHTRNTAWVVFNILCQPIISGDGSSSDPYTIESYEGLNPTTQIDTAFFYEWAQWCDEQVVAGEDSAVTENRFTCDYIADQESDVWTVATELAKIARCRLYWEGTVLTGWIDKPTSVVDMVTYKDMIGADGKNTWKSSWAPTDELAGKISVFFRDKQHNYKRRSIAVFSDAAGSYKRNVSIEASGCSSVSLATRIGNHSLQRNEKIRNYNDFEVGKIGLRWKLGEVLRVNHKTPNWGHSYRIVKRVSDNTIKVDRPEGDAELPISSGDALYVRGFDEADTDIELTTYTVDTFTRDEITITGTWDPDVQTGWVVAVGSVVLRRIIDKKWLPNHHFVFAVETYNSTVEDADDEIPALVQPTYTHTGFGSNRLLPPLNERQAIKLIEERIYSKSVPPLVSDIPYTTNIVWSGNDSDTVFWDPEDTEEDMIIAYKGVNYVITEDNSGISGKGGDTTDKWILFDPDLSGAGFITTDSDTTAYSYLEAGLWLMAINDNGVAHPATPMRLVHAGVLMARTITADLGQIANLAVGTLQIQDEAVTVPVSAYSSTPTEITSGTLKTVQNASITPHGGKMSINFSCMLTTNANANIVQIRVVRIFDNSPNTTSIIFNTGAITMALGANLHYPVGLTLADTNPGLEDVTYYAQMMKSAGVHIVTAYGMSMVLRETRK